MSTATKAFAFAFALIALSTSCGGKSVVASGSGGAGTSGDAGMPSGGTHPVVTLAVLEAGATSIAVDATRAYWLNASNKTVISCPIANCKPPLTVLADFQPEVTSLVVHEDTVYWGAVTRSVPASDDQTIRSCATTGCNDHPTTWLGPLRELIGPIATDDANLYVKTEYGIGVCALAGCNNQERPLVYSPTGVMLPVLVGGVMYWIEREGSPSLQSPATIKSCATTGCDQQPTTVVAAASSLRVSSGVNGLAVNDTRVFWSNLDGIWSCPKTACVTPTLMFPQEPMTQITSFVIADEANIFVCKGGTILKCAADGCAQQPTVIASFEGGCDSITQDARAIYWTTGSDVLMTTK